MAEPKPVRSAFTMMSFTPDVPSASLADQEYNSGYNVETDLRGVKKVKGEVGILSTIPGNVIFVTSGFRTATNYWMIVATREGRWYGITTSGITNITPGVGANPTVQLTGYSDSLGITEDWNGNILFVNDTINPPMYLLPEATEIRMYDHAPDNYVWNYNPAWTSLTAGFVRCYSAPNIGTILVSGNLTATTTTGFTQNMPTTVRWSQAFGLNSGPQTWEPTLINTANELEVPVRGPVIDGFPCNGAFYICSYWDTIILSPISYTTSTAPVFGVKLVNQGRGLLNDNCWCNADDTVYGVDARDIWVFNGGSFDSLGNQRVKDYFYANLNPTYVDRVFIQYNTSKNQVELYYPSLSSSDGHCDKMLSYRTDFKTWNPPRDVKSATQSTESPKWSGNVANLASRTIVYAQGSTSNSQLVQMGQGNSFLGNTAINSKFERNNINFTQPYSNKIQVHRVFPEVVGTGNISVTVGGANSVGSTPAYKPTEIMAIDTDEPYVQPDTNALRTVSVKVETNDATDTWEITAANWQINFVEDSH